MGLSGLGLVADGGSAAVDLSFFANLGDAAGDVNGDGLVQPGELSNSFQAGAGGDAVLDLPLYFPIKALPVGGTEADRNGDGIGDNVLHAAAGFAIDDSAKLTTTFDYVLPSFNLDLNAATALIALLNDAMATMGGLVGVPELSLQLVLGTLLAPLAFLMGVPWADAVEVGALLGIKTVLNEFIAYQQLGAHIAAGELAERSRVIASYALCGFANFGSLAILLGGIGGMAPSRRHEVASLGLRSILAGSLATFMTGCVAGILL